MHWILFVLGFTLYLIVRYRVAPITQTPAWLLWFVLMIPAFIMGIWTVLYGDSQSLPQGLLVVSFVFSALSYILLVQAGRKPTPSANPDQEKAPGITPEPSKPKKVLDSQEESQLQHCFPWSIYYLQKIDYRPQAVICRGQLRSDPAVAYQTIRENIQGQFGERFLILFQSNQPDQPYFALVPNPQRQRQGQSQGMQYAIVALLLVTTLLTTTLAGLSMAQPDLDPQQLIKTPTLLQQGLPYGLALMAILGVHEMGHFLAARYYRLKASLPFFIPSPFFLGTFGAFIQVRSPIPNRRTLFDVGIAGPLAGLLATLPFLLWGLVHSEVVPVPTSETALPTQAFDPKASFLFFLFCKVIYGAQLGLEQRIDLHPVAIAGGLGLLVTALNLMPVGQLDGGQMVHAMFGQRQAALIGHVSRLLLLLLSLIQPSLLLWSIFLLFMPVVSQPALNDVCELNDARDLLGLVSLALLLAIILPMPTGLASFFALAHP
ncbi:site-2 protease family protein [Lyngbya confervoides]|uniref:Site-2 protease family protein n=1 Tax=Lyngbya confervoides BDU141951 TaxID=1574623 RepID=A0ABD4SYD8_9CYAN|nr:site-2 protease family protein [Lyngbya confervoides]MCM1981466.1 site-2 protease family protein [Lyngbya confervoides BDU141951]